MGHACQVINYAVSHVSGIINVLHVKHDTSMLTGVRGDKAFETKPTFYMIKHTLCYQNIHLVFVLQLHLFTEYNKKKCPYFSCCVNMTDKGKLYN